MPSFNSLQDLKAVSDKLKKDARKAQEAKRIEAIQAQKKKNEKSEFLRAMGDLGVRPIQSKNRVEHSFQKEFKLQSELNDSPRHNLKLSDESENLDFISNDEETMFRLPFVSEIQVKQMVRGMRAIEATIDLHGYVADEARALFSDFVMQAKKHNFRCIKIIHGKGYGSSEGKPVLKILVRRWLRQTSGVLAFADAQEAFGGAGATLIMLESIKH